MNGFYGIIFVFFFFHCGRLVVTSGNMTSSERITYKNLSVNLDSADVYTTPLVNGSFNYQKADDEAPSSRPRIGLSLLLAFISIFTVVGNTMVIMAVVIFRKLRRINNLLIVSLASADLIMGGAVLPLGSHYVVGSKWLLGTAGCNIWTSIDVLSVTASIGTLCAISLDRFVAIVMPFEYSTKMTKNRACAIIVFIWVTSAAIAFIPINLGLWKTDEKDDLECYNDPHCCEFRINKTYAVVSSLISFYIPLIVMIFAYSIVFKIAIQKRSKICNHEGVYRRASMPGSRTLLWGRGEYRAVFTMGIIMGTFVVCWLPFFIVNIVQVFCDRCVSQTVFTILNWLGYANSFFNPVIYCHSKEFRRAFKRLVLCSLCREGYQQTSRASLSVSYTPSISLRSSLRTESSLFQFTNFFLSRKSSTQRRASKLSSSSTKTKKSPQLDDYNSEGLHMTPLENGNSSNVLLYKNDRQKDLGCNGNVLVSDFVKENLIPSEQEDGLGRSCCSSNLVTYRSDQSRRVGIASSYRPVFVPKQTRSLSTYAGNGEIKRVLFKIPSQNDVSHKMSDANFLTVKTEEESPRSSIVTPVLDLLEETSMEQRSEGQTPNKEKDRANGLSFTSVLQK